jgi:N-dimethylarginine dimethylaminohydrolase
MSGLTPVVGFACLEDILPTDISNVIYMMLDDHSLHLIACLSTQNRRNAMSNNSLWNARFLREFGDDWKGTPL